MVIIDPGHGGADPGGGTNDYWKEKDLALKISQYQLNRFKDLGIPAQLTRYDDEYLSPTERVERVKAAYGAYDTVIGLSNHINNDYGKADGAEVFYSIYDSNVLANSIGKAFEEVGQNVRYVTTRENSNGEDYYFIIRNTRPIKMNLVEYGYADSPGDDVNKLLLDWETLAEAPIKAVANYLGVDYIPSSYEYYTVVSGDTLYKIANNYGTTVNTIKSLNNLTSDVLQIGQQLKVPSTTETKYKTVKYTVVLGDTLSEIALNYGTSVDQIMEVNGLSDTMIYVNQVLNIPLPVNLVEYVVVAGDNLWDISNKYGTTVEKLMLYNNLDSIVLQIGQVLFVPS